MDQVEQFAQALGRLQSRSLRCDLSVDWGTMVCVVSSCQLALRHAQFPTGIGRAVRVFVASVLERIDSVDPELAAIMRLGDDPAQDR